MTLIEKIKAEIRRQMAIWDNTLKDIPSNMGMEACVNRYNTLADMLEFVESLESENRSNSPKILPNSPKIKGWIARDENGCLFLYRTKPKRYSRHDIFPVNPGVWSESPLYISGEPLPKDKFPNLTWKDDPIEVELTINPIKNMKVEFEIRDNFTPYPDPKVKMQVILKSFASLLLATMDETIYNIKVNGENVEVY